MSFVFPPTHCCGCCCCCYCYCCCCCCCGMFIFCYCLARLNMPTPKGQAFVPHRLNLHFAKDMRLLLQLRVQFPSTFCGCTLNRLRCGCYKVSGWVWSRGEQLLWGIFLEEARATSNSQRPAGEFHADSQKWREYIFFKINIT